jgi:hypothetical protein
MKSAATIPYGPSDPPAWSGANPGLVSTALDHLVAGTDLYLNVARGIIPGWSSVQKFGRNSDIDTTTDPEDIWDGGAIWVPPTQARVHDLVSTDTDDDDGGTGANTVEVTGQDANGDEVTETVTMDGTSNAATTNSYTTIYRMKVLTAGTTGTNEGAITATAQTDGTVTAQITASMGQTLMAIYTIPTGKTGYLTNWYASLNSSGGSTGNADIRLMAQASGGAWQTKSFRSLLFDGKSDFTHPFQAINSFAAGTIIKAQCFFVSASNADCSAGFDIILIDD